MRALVVALTLFAHVVAVSAAELGLRPIRSVRIGGDDAVQVPLDELFHWYDDFGAAIAWVDDVDGDGVSDIAVGAPSTLEGSSPGNVIVLLLERDGGVKAAYALGGFNGQGINGSRRGGDRFGAAVAAIGDLDGNGVRDVVVGAPGDDTAAENAGAIHVLFLEPNGEVLSETKITSGLGGFDFVLAAIDGFGSSIAVLPEATVGSVRLIVGAPHGVDGVGRVFTLELDGAGAVVDATEIRADDAAVASSSGLGIRFGAAVAVPGDIDGNTVDDFVVGSPSFDTPGDGRLTDQQGSVWVLLRNAAGGVQSSVRLGTRSGGFPHELTIDAGFGAAVGAIGDRDGNGVPDVLVGVPGEQNVWVLLLTDTGTIASARRFDRQSFFEPTPVALGTAVASIGDFDGNGIPDFAIGGDATFEGFPGTTTTLLSCTTYVTTSTSLTSTTTLPASLFASPPACGGGARRAALRVARNVTPQRCFRTHEFNRCGRPKTRRCGSEHVRLVFLDENADIADCGDGARDPGEACDDGNTEDGDCCTADCLTAPRDNECRFDGNPCAEHRCDGNGACELRAMSIGQECVDHFGCVEAGACSAEGRCVDPGTVVSVCRADDGVCYRCGQPVSASGHPRATDALYVLQAAVGVVECEPCICDVDSNGSVSAADALSALFLAVEAFPANPVCPHR